MELGMNFKISAKLLCQYPCTNLTSLDSMPRNNLLPKARNYFKLYFKHYAYT